MASLFRGASASLLACLLGACATSPMSVTGHFDTDASLLQFGAPSQFNSSDVQAQLRQQVPLLYFYAYQAGVLTSDRTSGKYPTFTTKLDEQQEALLTVPRQGWIAVAQAGESSIDTICVKYESALYQLDRNRRTTLSNLTTIQSATVGIMGLALAAQKTIGIVGIAFGLAASLFDTTVSSVLYQLPPVSVVTIMNAQRNIFRSEENVTNTEWTSIQSPIGVAKRLGEYIRYCTPVIIEANVAKVLAQTKAQDGVLTSQTQPATGLALPGLERSLETYSPELRDQIFALTPSQALVVENEMWSKLDERPVQFQRNLRAMAGPLGVKTGPEAQALLRRWILLENATPSFAAEWNDAIRTALSSTRANNVRGPQPVAMRTPTRGATESAGQATAGLERQILQLHGEEAVAVARLMYPKLMDRPPDLQRTMTALVGSAEALSAENAKPFLIAWLRSDVPSSSFRAQWTAALAELRLTNPSPRYRVAA